MVQAANQGADADTPACHFLDVPAGVTHITDVLITSPILQSEDMMGGAAGGGAAAAGGEFGVDPSMDPELAMALRLSMEEANANANPPAADPAPA
jgi:26S proteasome regulatory subunit N10